METPVQVPKDVGQVTPVGERFTDRFHDQQRHRHCHRKHHEDASDEHEDQEPELHYVLFLSTGCVVSSTPIITHPPVFYKATSPL